MARPEERNRIASEKLSTSERNETAATVAVGYRINSDHPAVTLAWQPNQARRQASSVRASGGRPVEMLGPSSAASQPSSIKALVMSIDGLMGIGISQAHTRRNVRRPRRSAPSREIGRLR